MPKSIFYDRLARYPRRKKSNVCGSIATADVEPFGYRFFAFAESISPGVHVKSRSGQFTTGGIDEGILDHQLFGLKNHHQRSVRGLNIKFH